MKVCEERAYLEDSSCPRSTFDFDEFEFSKRCTDTAINYTGEKLD